MSFKSRRKISTVYLAYSRVTLKSIQCDWDEFSVASGVQSAQQARKIYTSRI